MNDARLNEGIAALRAGNKVAARRHLRAFAEKHPERVEGWLWLSGAVESDAERVECLQNALRADPENKQAAKALLTLIASEKAVVRSPEPPSEPVDVREPELAARIPPVAPEPAQPTVETSIFWTRPSIGPIALLSLPTTAVVALASRVLWQYQGLMLVEILARYLAIMLPIIAATGLVYAWLFRLRTRYELTSQRLRIESGVLNRRRDEFAVEALRSVTLRQSLLERPFDAGDITVELRGGRHPVKLHDIAACRQRADALRQLVPGGP